MAVTVCGLCAAVTRLKSFLDSRKETPFCEGVMNGGEWGEVGEGDEESESEGRTQTVIWRGSGVNTDTAGGQMCSDMSQ